MMPSSSNADRLVILILASSAVCAQNSSSSSSSRFDSQPICPSALSDWSVLDVPVSGVTRPNSCIVECAVRPNCSAVHYNKTAASCWTASGWQWQDRWGRSATPSADCLTFTKRPSPAQQLPATLQASLTLWYSFRYSLDNLAGNGTVQQAVAGLRFGAVRNASGLVLNPSTESHANVSIPGGGNLESLFSSGKFSVYIKVDRRPRGQEVSYLQTSESSGKAVTFMSEAADGKFTVGCRLYAQRSQTTTQAVLKTPIAAGWVSVGFSYDGSAFRVFNNATMYATSNDGNLPAVSASTETRIGGKYGDSTATLDGRVLCFGLANRQLSLSEFETLEAACD
ncbi:hypothetical protein BOX15_Mlig013932g1 [Macrostomum lignano]|uniref:Apple domain-containing protein n=1 Tax=Macrostomum lignano TaxID=282301 RepID=A0A267DNP4_9PLAT|nr:hypothetical protein BOX15_Mlig012771g1 [Macrostomum lignano]PAA88388.1 hypothetical protein BOX15_Mlig013932g1 [Macrostomum lignano]